MIQPQQKAFPLKPWRRWALRVLLGLFVCAVAAVAWVAWECRDLPGTSEIRAQLWTRYHPAERSIWVPLWAISPRLQTSVVAWEDPEFYFHRGFDCDEIWRAAVRDVETRSYRMGGSTITQQVAKNLFLTQHKTIRRKVREAVLAWRLERALSKDEILEIYLNIADWGDGIRGAEAASRAYFGKSAGSLTWGESAMLASMLANPHRFGPVHAPETARRRRELVLAELAMQHQITTKELKLALVEPCCEGMRRAQ